MIIGRATPTLAIGMGLTKEIRQIKKTIFSLAKFNSNIERKESKNNIFATIGSVVQLDRISDFGSDGWGFESLRGHKSGMLTQ